MALTYYLAIDGFFGDSTGDTNKGAFDVIGYSFDVSAVLSAATGGGRP
ncbi:hypothetical protein [Bradyrhizobium sp. AUGA SZCCT0283]|nr:hypothetical protein [Bradyrhizobium sp. AUGA SZCCT0283]MBR1279003.1 hypothetical protein [Bradyrhizobium sp. AUGA SZCCT0283]